MKMQCEGECHRITSHEIQDYDEENDEPIWGCQDCGQVRSEAKEA